MSGYYNIIKNTIAAIAIILISSSCLDQEINKNEEEAQAKMDVFLKANNYTEEHKIGSGIYVKTIESGDKTSPTPIYGNTVLLKYTGMLTTNKIFETTDYNQAGSLPNFEYYMYGSKRLKVGTMFVGFDTAIKTMHEKEIAQFVIPHQYAFGNYDPVVYNVELLEIIENDSIYEADLFAEFTEANGFLDSNYLAPELLYKLTDGDELINNDTLKVNDTIQMLLTARYAEVYYDNKLGRVFFPRPNTYETSVFDSTYLWGTSSNYPILNAIDSAVKYMQIDQTMEIAFKSGAFSTNIWGYPNGLIDGVLNFYIVPPYTPVHYTIKLTGIK